MNTLVRPQSNKFLNFLVLLLVLIAVFVASRALVLMPGAVGADAGDEEVIYSSPEAKAAAEALDRLLEDMNLLSEELEAGSISDEEALEKGSEIRVQGRNLIEQAPEMPDDEYEALEDGLRELREKFLEIASSVIPPQ